MNSEMDIQKLLQLKRHEGPPSGFHEHFLNEFQKRQREDLLRRTLRPSIRQVLVERISCSVHSTCVPLMAYALIGVAGFFVSVAIWLHYSESPEKLPSASLAGYYFNARPPLSFVNASASGESKEDINFSLTSPVAIPKQQPVSTQSPYYFFENRPTQNAVPLDF